MLLVLALVVTGAVYGIKALVNTPQRYVSAEESGEVMEVGPAALEEPAGETTPEIDKNLNPDAAFALGNDAYEAGDYPLAEAYYRHAASFDEAKRFTATIWAWPCCSGKRTRRLLHFL
jgi:hypothetical protein